MQKGLVVVFGGSGFIGQYVARQLIEEGYRVRVACRRPHIVPHLKLSGTPGTVDLVQCNVRDPYSLNNVLNGAGGAIYLPGLLHERGNQTFQNVHVSGPENVAKACIDSGIGTFVHISAIGASLEGPSNYLKTKAKGEQAVKELMPTARILRPSIVFGPEDEFFNRFANLSKFSPVLPALKMGQAVFQPVYVNDLAKAVVAALNPQHAGEVFEIAGPERMTLNDVYDKILNTIDKKRLKLPLPLPVMEPFGILLGASFRYIPPLSWGLFGPPPLTGDQIRSLSKDSCESGEAKTLSDLGVTDLKTVDSVIPDYLWIHRTGGEFHQKATEKTSAA